MTVTIHQVTHTEGGRVHCTCGWSSVAPVFNPANAQRFATRHIETTKGRNR
jgi:hypothetical protein